MRAMFLLLVLACWCGAAAQQPIVNRYSERLLLDSMPTKACHAATLAEVKPGKIIAAWFGGSYEGAKDVSIYCCTIYPVQGKPKRVALPVVKGKDTLPCWNPVLYKSKSGMLYLFYKVGKNPREWKGYMITSKNEGDSWSKPHALPEGFLGPIKNKPIEVRKGILLCPSSVETIMDNRWMSHVELYNEATLQWRKIPIDSASKFGVIQPTLLSHNADTVQALMRSRQNRIVESWSYDGGNTWQKMDTLSVLNPNSGIDAVRLNRSCFLLVNSPLLSGKDWFNGRNVLELAYSKDGRHWSHLQTLENEPEGEFSYPAIINDSRGVVHIIYTYNRQNFKYAQVVVRCANDAKLVKQEYL
ncbi:sialidase family protein [Acetobacteroides hydrogenigenes]|nr:sialidase family protein [Acetobacteroides hydrogenigenes]